MTINLLGGGSGALALINSLTASLLADRDPQAVRADKVTSPSVERLITFDFFHYMNPSANLHERNPYYVMAERNLYWCLSTQVYTGGSQAERSRLSLLISL